MINDRVLEVLPGLDRAQLERLTRRLLDELDFLDEHDPEAREQLGCLSCSGRTWCFADYGGPSPCKHTVSVEPWCKIGGFGCADCALVLELQRLLVTA